MSEETQALVGIWTLVAVVLCFSVCVVYAIAYISNALSLEHENLTRPPLSKKKPRKRARKAAPTEVEVTPHASPKNFRTEPSKQQAPPPRNESPPAPIYASRESKALQTWAGKLLSVSSANRKCAEASYQQFFAVILGKNGEEQVRGNDLERAFTEAGVKCGDNIIIRYIGLDNVVVHVKGVPTGTKRKRYEVRRSK